MLRALVSPTYLVVVGSVVCERLARGDAMGAMVLPAVVTVVALEASLFRVVRRVLDRAAASRAREHRRIVRYELLLAAGDDDRSRYLDLRCLTDQVDPRGEHGELEQLLDRFAQLAVAHQRCRGCPEDAARIADDLDTTADLVQLTAERLAAGGAVIDLERGVGRRLAMLDQR